jgi:hypothetical protein
LKKKIKCFIFTSKKNTISKEFSALVVQSKGFLQETTLDDESVAMLKLAHWFKEVQESGFKSFSIFMKTIMNHYNDILNYFGQRSTNASAESFNAKIKNFRIELRGVRDKTFFLFRLSQLFAYSPSFGIDPYFVAVFCCFILGGFF